MTTRKERLHRFVVVQEKLRSLHETRHAGFLATAAKADADALDLAARFDTEGSLAATFPDLYNRKISQAISRREASLLQANAEAARVATATVRTHMIDKAYRVVARKDERDTADRDQLDSLQHNRARQKPK